MSDMVTYPAGTTPRAGEENRVIFPIGQYRFAPSLRKLTFSRETFRLTYRESDLLLVLAMHADKLLPRADALREVWGNDNMINARIMDVYITRLRKLLSQDASLSIVNVRGRGYKLITTGPGDRRA